MAKGTQQEWSRDAQPHAGFGSDILQLCCDQMDKPVTTLWTLCYPDGMKLKEGEIMHVMPSHAMLCYAMPSHTTPLHAVQHQIITHHAMPCHTIPPHTIAHHIMPTHTIQLILTYIDSLHFSRLLCTDFGDSDNNCASSKIWSIIKQQQVFHHLSSSQGHDADPAWYHGTLFWNIQQTCSQVQAVCSPTLLSDMLLPGQHFCSQKQHSPAHTDKSDCAPEITFPGCNSKGPKC